tara:strand:+ start:1903 stop:3204 length:1302 start_codon:yes stop_codon:yes gene_type:complete
MKYDFSENIQRGILFLSKYNRDFYLQIASLVKEEYFEFPIHGKLFSTIRIHYDKYSSLPTDDFLVEEVKNVKEGKEQLSDYVDELHYINSMDTSSIDNVEFYLDIVESFARKEAMKSAITESIGLMKDDKIDEIESVVRKALTVNRNVDYGHLYFDGIKERFERIFMEAEGERFSLVFPTLNRELEGGLSRKELAMVVAPPGVGKSLYLVNQGVQALMENKKVLYISLEMSEDKIAQRFDSVTTLIQQRNLKEKYHIVSERLQVFKDEFPESRLIIKEFPTGLATVNAIRSLMVQLKNYEDFVPDIILLDYLELMRPTREGLAEYQAQQRISEELRGLAVENNILVWTATQTNRQGRSVKLITDAELADAYGKIRTCDYAVSLNQTEEEFDEGRMRAYVMKSRNGKQRFVVPVNIDYSILRLTEGEDYFDDEE